MPDFVNTIFRTEGNYAQSHTSEPLSTLLTTAREPLYTCSALVTAQKPTWTTVHI